MNWYMRHEGTGTIAGPMTYDDALEIAEHGMVFSEAVFDQEVEEEVILDIPKETKNLLAEMESVATAGIVIPHVIQEVMKRAIDTIVVLSREKLVTGTIEGGVLSLDDVPEGVIVDIRDYDTDGVYEEVLEEDEKGTHFQAG